MGQIRKYNKIRKYFKQNKGKNTLYHNLWDIAKLILREMFIVLNAYIGKEKKNINELRF